MPYRSTTLVTLGRIWVRTVYRVLLHICEYPKSTTASFFWMWRLRYRILIHPRRQIFMEGGTPEPSPFDRGLRAKSTFFFPCFVGMHVNWYHSFTNMIVPFAASQNETQFQHTCNFVDNEAKLEHSCKKSCWRPLKGPPQCFGSEIVKIVHTRTNFQ